MTSGFDPALPPRLIVCERSGQWAVALRRELPGGDVRVHETRSLRECWRVLGRHLSSFVVVELTEANADDLLDRLARLERVAPLARAAVVAERSLAAYEPLVREAGAVHFIAGTRDLCPLARLACRHLDQAALQGPCRSVSQAIWDGLPWGR